MDRSKDCSVTKKPAKRLKTLTHTVSDPVHIEVEIWGISKLLKTWEELKSTPSVITLE
jgi:hypothetical protein